jgi:hypothetical protein
VLLAARDQDRVAGVNVTTPGTERYGEPACHRSAHSGGKRSMRLPVTNPRARQNVVFETGFFFGQIGRSRFCVLYNEAVELPSDVNGLVYVQLDAAEAWKSKWIAELEHAGIRT